MNIWNFTGNLGNTAEQRLTSGGDSVVSFSVAVKSGYGDKAQTTWANCAMFGKRGEAVLKYLAKGQLVGVSGEATLRKYTNKNGVEGSSLDVRVNDLTLLGGKADRPEQTVEQKPAQTVKAAFDAFDDAPF